VRVGVTGATGYIGQALVRAAPEHWQLVSLGRRPARGVDEHRHADLGQPLPDALIDGLDAVVHLAADTGAGALAPERELAFARELALAARSSGTRLLFLSSQASSPQAPTTYGRTKAAIEAAILPLGAGVVRPGMVYGGVELGLFGTLCAMLRRVPLRPRLLPSPRVQPIHVDDLCAAIIAALGDPALPARVYRVADVPIDFDAFLAAIARHRLRRPRPGLPVPVFALKIALRLAQVLVGPRLGPGRLDSLLLLPGMDAQADLARLGVVPRDLRDGLSRAGTPRRRLLVEGRALSRALLGRTRIPDATLRRYVRALRAHGHATALDLPPVLVAWPALLSALDRPSGRGAGTRGGLAWRMDVAYRLCESDPAVAPAFLGEGAGGRVAALADIARAGVAEVAARCLHPLAARMGRGR
jgi:NADH dehydrogenase